MIHRGTLILLLFISVCSFSQEAQERINWKQGLLLTWEDFKAVPDSEISYSANTNSGLSYSWNYSTASGQPVLHHEVFTNFYPQKSWVKENINDQAYLLTHEQAHFDISELFARKLRQALINYEIGRNIRQDLKRIYQKIESERVSMQNRFDKETAHSENRSAELKWRKYIQEELNKLENFSS